MNKERVKHLIEVFGNYSFEGEGINRIAYTNVETAAKHHFMRLCMAQGMTVRMDAIGNVIARKDGLKDGLPVIAMGSHLDSVYDGGLFDGLVGVIGGLEVVTSLNEQGIITNHPIEIIVFACEESSRFGVSTIGSKVMTNQLSAKELLSLKDRNEISFEDALSSQNLSIEKIDEVVRNKSELKAFIELHIEQGPILEKEQLEIGVVTSIAAPARYQIKVLGEAAHSGTTPMEYRKDALAAASELVLKIESLGIKESVYSTVATVGVLSIKPGGMNIIPGEALLQVDIRGIDMESRNRVTEELIETIFLLKNQRNVEIEIIKLSEEQSVPMDEYYIDLLLMLAEKNNFKVKKMSSGAGHDVMNMAKLFKSAMIFVPSKYGISHNPKEYTCIQEIMKGISLMKDFLLAVDKE
ncbi:M20 family metallo-hydrolase [Lysinibacillus telephonicus]|uniref:Zn-dependent hydrolase n=1 Tax=Lysinibacillus telephonicus TaxID=1714840 RepID=A0A3S0QWT5_9BACI|nr:M20 family metallo-hydrolase [Lysinibacillus telephonicus]RTQ94331.1 Zn-dependent hydrolase [Lysinibacillus telephonicus]